MSTNILLTNGFQTIFFCGFDSALELLPLKTESGKTKRYIEKEILL